MEEADQEMRRPEEGADTQGIWSIRKKYISGSLVTGEDKGYNTRSRRDPIQLCVPGFFFFGIYIFFIQWYHCVEHIQRTQTMQKRA